MKTFWSKIILSLSLIGLVFVGCSQKNEMQMENISKSKKSTFVLVHSAWLGAWSWGYVKKELENLGHKVVVLDLPAHGKDKTKPKDVMMKDYTDAVIKVIKQQDEKVVLVGHSFAGVITTQVAEYIPEKIKGLAYLTAFLLPDGVSFIDATKGVKTSMVLNNLVFSDDKSYVTVKEDVMHEAFGKDIPLEVFLKAKPNLSAEPTNPLFHKLHTTKENWGSIPRYYIQTLKDNAIPNSIQKYMYNGVGVNKVYTLKDSSHLPIFSQPKNVASYLDDIAKRSSILEDFRKYSENWIKNFNNNNIEACIDAYTDNAIMTIKGVGVFKGKSQIGKFWRDFSKTATNLVYSNTKLNLVDEKTVHLSSNWRMNVGEGIITLEEWVKQDNGSWKLTNDKFQVLKKYK